MTAFDELTWHEAIRQGHHMACVVGTEQASIGSATAMYG